MSRTIEATTKEQRIAQMNAGQANLGDSAELIFTKIFVDNLWRDGESISGPGSTIEYTAPLIEALPLLFDTYGIAIINDAPCGDFNWMQHVDMRAVQLYRGFDVVADLVARNAEKYTDEKHTFAHADITRDILPPADLIICRDCMFHLSFDAITAALQNFKASGSRFLLATSHIDHFNNTDIATGGFRLLNLESAPFLLPPALEYLADRGTYPEGHKQYNRHLVLWDLQQLTIPTA